MSISPALGLFPLILLGFIRANLGLDNFGAKSSFSVRENEIIIEVVTSTHLALKFMH
jgi:hypothetical protein